MCIYLSIYLYKMEYYSIIEKDEILPFEAMGVDIHNIMLSEMSERERKILYDITYMCNLENNANGCM